MVPIFTLFQNKFLLVLSLSAVFITNTFAIWSPNIYQDTVYNANVRSIKFSLEGLQTAPPFLQLKSGLNLRLMWDILGEESPQLRYKIEYANADWTPSNLQRFEYMDGYEDDPVVNFQFSAGTFVKYVHYELSLPNENTNLLLSGNYVLHIFNSETMEPLFTRRFCIVEPIFSVSYTMNNPVEATLIDTHQEIDLEIFAKNFALFQPMNEVSLTILQNYRWNTALNHIKPRFCRNDKLIFDYDDKILFPGGKEFRNFDIRDYKARTEFVDRFNRYENGIEAILRPQKSRGYSTYNSGIIDANGKFVLDALTVLGEKSTRSEYLEVLFQLEGSVEQSDQVWVIGEFTDWALKDEYRLKYDPDKKCLTARTILKQGRYEYFFATSDKGIPETQKWEGNSNDTENIYTVLIYHRPFGQRYDRLVGIYSFKSI